MSEQTTHVQVLLSAEGSESRLQKENIPIEQGLIETSEVTETADIESQAAKITVEFEQDNQDQAKKNAATAAAADDLNCALTWIRSLTEDELVLGITLLNNGLYVRLKERQDVSLSGLFRFWSKEDEQNKTNIVIYNTDSFDTRRRLPLPGISNLTNDVTSCRRHRCIYIADPVDNTIHRYVEEGGGLHSRWSVDEEPVGLSVGVDDNLIVTFGWPETVKKIKVFTTFGGLVKEIYLQSDNAVHPWHTIQLKADSYIFCHGYSGDKLHRVCRIDNNGRVLRSFGRSPGPKADQLNWPVRLAAAIENRFVFVVDRNNKRLMMLDATSLNCMRVCSFVDGSGRPERICFDEETRRLYVAHSKWDRSRRNGQIDVYGFAVD